MQNYTDLLAKDDRTLLQQYLADGAVFLTPNTRLASQLRDLLDSLQAPSLDKNNDIAWRSSDVLPFDQWLMKKFNAFQLSGEVEALQLVTRAEELALWQQVATSASSSETMLAVSSAVAEAQKAYNLLREWQIDLNEYHFEFQVIPDCQVFYDWVLLFEKISSQTKVIAWADAKQVLLAINSNLCTQKVVLVGFQKLTPLQEALAKKYSANNSLLQISLRTKCKNAKLLHAQNFEEEISTAAAWAQGVLQHDPKANIGIVVKDLEQHKLLVERVMLETFDQESFFRGQPGSSARFNISAGTALSKTPVATVFLSLLESLFMSLSISHWQRILTSPYIFETEGKVNLASNILKAMHKSGEPVFKFNELPRLLVWYDRERDSLSQSSDQSESLVENKILQQGVDQLLALNRDVKHAQLRRPSFWLDKVQQVIASFGWPNERVLDSNEYQQWQRFLESADLFRRFDKVLGDISLQETCAKFKMFCNSIVFHRETTIDPSGCNPVQVLGMLEASGQLFDHLWLVGMSDRQWPMSVNPHPMLPLVLQYEKAMPSASVEVELNYARNLTYDFLQAAPHIVLSFPKQIDEVNVVLSPLLEQAIKQLSLTVETTSVEVLLKDRVGKTELILADKPFEYIADHVGQPWQKLEKNDENILSGGVSAIQDFASNPLRAYARRRLRIEPLRPVVEGISPLERGNLVHYLLEGIWGELCGSQTLHLIDAIERDLLIDKQLLRYIDSIFSRRFLPPSAKLIDLECQNIKRLIEHWLLLESKRPKFEIYALEKNIEVSIGGFKIKGRVDRVDRLEDGQLLLIDYKTGVIRANAWLESPLTAIQLPLYAVAINNNHSALLINQKTTNQESINQQPIDQETLVDEESYFEVEPKMKVSAIALASLKPGYLKMQGYCDISSAAIDITGIKSPESNSKEENYSWQFFEQSWLTDINLLVDDIRLGRVALDLLQHATDELYEPFIRSAFSETHSQLDYET